MPVLLVYLGFRVLQTDYRQQVIILLLNNMYHHLITKSWVWTLCYPINIGGSDKSSNHRRIQLVPAPRSESAPLGDAPGMAWVRDCPMRDRRNLQCGVIKTLHMKNAEGTLWFCYQLQCLEVEACALFDKDSLLWLSAQETKSHIITQIAWMIHWSIEFDSEMTVVVELLLGSFVVFPCIKRFY